MIAGLMNGFPDGELYVIIGRQRGEVYEKNKRSVLDFFEDRCVYIWRRLCDRDADEGKICRSAALDQGR